MNAVDENDRSPRSQRKCPVCGKPAVARYRPFCSKRCADIDLGRWFNEAYRIPTEEEDADKQSRADDEQRDDEHED